MYGDVLHCCNQQQAGQHLKSIESLFSTACVDIMYAREKLRTCCFDERLMSNLYLARFVCERTQDLIMFSLKL